MTVTTTKEVTDQEKVDEIVCAALNAHCWLRDSCDEVEQSWLAAKKNGETLPRGVNFARQSLPDALGWLEHLCDLLAVELGTEILKDVPPYEKWPKDELRSEADCRDLPTAGTKAEIIKRLREDDVWRVAKLGAPS